MIIQLKPSADIERLTPLLQALGLWSTPLGPHEGTISALAIAEHSAHVSSETLLELPGVEAVLNSKSQHPLVDAQAGKSVRVSDCLFGDNSAPVLIAGPCSVSSETQIHEAAKMVKQAGAQLLRGGAYKPRTSPYSFSGHGELALQWLRSAADEYSLGVVTEVMSELQVDRVSQFADMIQIGSRNMQNFSLLAAVGAAKRPVLLKRGMSATVKQWLLAGEHLLKAGATGVVFCERGIQSFDTETRNLLDLSSVALLKHVYQQPVIVDPSHAMGRRDLIIPMAKAALAAGAHGLLVEAEQDLEAAISDGPQALTFTELSQL